MSHARCGLALAVFAASCGGGGQWMTDVTELPPGTCQPASDSTCEHGSLDYALGAAVTTSTAHTSDVGGRVSGRWRFFEVELDERALRRGTDPSTYASLAGGIGVHLSPLRFEPDINRYLDIALLAGADLGAIKESSHADTRFDGYVGGALEVDAPDFGPFAYFDNGVPGLRLGARWSSYVQGWSSSTTIDLSIVWRWGTPIDRRTTRWFKTTLD